MSLVVDLPIMRATHNVAEIQKTMGGREQEYQTVWPCWKLITTPCLRNYMTHGSQKTSHMSPCSKVNEYLKFAKPRIVYSLLEFFRIVLSKSSLQTHSCFLSPWWSIKSFSNFNFICINWKTLSILEEYMLTKKVCSTVMSISVHSLFTIMNFYAVRKPNNRLNGSKYKYN